MQHRLSGSTDSRKYRQRDHLATFVTYCIDGLAGNIAAVAIAAIAEFLAN